jgi:CRP-like cAMP-binding protein
LEKGEVTQEFFVVISGEVCRTAPDEDRVYLEAGSHFGEIALLYDQVCPFLSYFLPHKNFHAHKNFHKNFHAS